MDGQSELERRMIPVAPDLEVRADENGKTVVRGRAIVWNSYSQDFGGWVEKINPRAFDAVLATSPDVMARYNHERLLARTSSGTLRLKPTAEGLDYDFDPKPADADLVQSLGRGDVRGSSFAFRVAPDGERWYHDENGVLVREITAASLLADVGPVDNPAYPASQAFVSKRALEHARAEIEARQTPPPEEAEREPEAPVTEPDPKAEDGQPLVTPPDERSHEPDYLGQAMALKSFLVTTLWNHK